ncbi:ubiquinol-cytochrome c reductase iron-sulfur subunit [Candidatus Neomicrothrix sp.]|uniref:Cytochrome bc1 complex Rieske iron-sulfur subunit n=1 Tax=Candidatus Neomicrothrix subdominans TaxID=2954438 RepID=A0A936NED4_9ACTN|nr:ubiquinol-cytochrome c reductase iron-sulfur subunit [Candidatus Microthrix sp.]MBK9298074.1 ubiquinol-cytochrome c reductase iron-sulfur subunit [Candidatus Microthrix subdominans]MBK6309582.1 ubiquinol-cytochrome c reductase iron-sulfur subunit [Candidatus Microthrix sp.]MBK6439103.1 ubiquinol-cytochrome c reductase iron-sulfur subunit [Candidatus Microthrix sp.]MBK6967974.1 ubiquinol-cytochrome c reductase iron-sulfur subunit [Candidatus Microthrix sp.]MBK7164473.1 ubiquinol-cytochrome c
MSDHPDHSSTGSTANGDMPTDGDAAVDGDEAVDPTLVPRAEDAHLIIGGRVTVPVMAFSMAIVASIALAWVYAIGGQPQAEGIFLALALAGIGIGLVSWAHRFLPAEEVEEYREPLASPPEELEALEDDLELAEEDVGRRKILVRMLGGVAAAFGVAVLFPLRSLGPRPGQGLTTTPMAKGVRLVTPEGQPVKPGDIATSGVLTVMPEGHLDDANSPTLLIRLTAEQLGPQTSREGYGLGTLVAFSKICTHAGCPVGLYESNQGLLFCPCHQSTFDVTKGCKVIFGPAPRDLPQLPIGMDDEGYLVAEGDFERPVGPGFWTQDRDS